MTLDGVLGAAPSKGGYAQWARRSAAFAHAGPVQAKCRTASAGTPRTCGCTHVSPGRSVIPTAAALRAASGL
jgi:hypothetical protein